MGWILLNKRLIEKTASLYSIIKDEADRSFSTGIMPLPFAHSNVAFLDDISAVSGLVGLTHEDVRSALKDELKIENVDDHFYTLVSYFGGYRFNRRQEEPMFPAAPTLSYLSDLKPDENGHADILGENQISNIFLPLSTDAYKFVRSHPAFNDNSNLDELLAETEEESSIKVDRMLVFIYNIVINTDVLCALNKFNIVKDTFMMILYHAGLLTNAEPEHQANGSLNRLVLPNLLVKSELTSAFVDVEMLEKIKASDNGFKAFLKLFKKTAFDSAKANVMA